MTTAQKFLEVAESQLGIAEAPVNKTKYGKFTGHDEQPWCGSFVMWCANEAGFKAMPNVVYTPAGADAFKGKGLWANPQTYKPQPGDIVFFNFDGRRIEHVGIVIKDNGDGTITTVEGNTSPDTKPTGSQANGGEVCKKTRAYLSTNKKHLPVFIAGFGKPKWSN